jgi:hypothetical protein
MITQGISAPITTEQMRETLSRLLDGINSNDPKELAEQLFHDNGEFAVALVGAIPRMVSAMTGAVRTFVESLESMPAEKSAQLIASAYAGVDGREFGEAVNAFSRLVIKLHEENPELFSSSRFGLAAEVMQSADFGKLRKAITYRGGERLELLRREVELLGDNPVALVNLFSVVAPLVNDAVRVLKTLLDILKLPAEAMTFALFKILEDLDWREFAAVINGIADIVVILHRGSYILGDGSLYTRSPLARIASAFIDGLDGQAVAEALAGIGEEGEAFLTALAGSALGDESIVVPIFEGALSLTNSIFAAIADIFEKVSSLPSGTTAGITHAVAEELDANQLARVLNALAAAVRHLALEEPGLLRKLSRQTLDNLELDFGPEAIAAGVNRALASYNGWAVRKPETVAESVGVFLAGIDAGELERAAKTASGQLAAAVSRNPAVMKSAFKAVMSLVYGSAKGYLKGIRGLRKRRER